MAENINLETLKRSRTSIKGRLTRLGNWIASIESPSDISLDDLETRLAHLTKCYEEFEYTQSQIELLHDDSEDAESQRSSIEEYFFGTVSAYKKCIRSLTATSAPPIISQPSSVDGTSMEHMPPTISNPLGVQTQNSMFGPEFKLPPISLPHFSGEIDEFESFSELFRSIVDSSPHLTNTTRFYYLRSALKGAAANVIRSLPATAQNYDTAWSLLNQRFSCKGTTVNKLNSELLSLPALQNDHPSGLRKLLDNVTRILRSLTAHNTIKKNGDAIFVTIITNKLDVESRKLFQMSLPDANYIASVDDLQDFLSRRIQVLESLQVSRKDTGRNVSTFQSVVQPTQTSNRPSNQPFKPDRRSTQGNASNSNKPPARASNSTLVSTHLCILCKCHTHLLARCPTYLDMSVDDRIRCITSNQACYNCLSPNHAQAKCPSSFSCKHCSRRHHSTIHRHPPTNDQINEPVASTSSNSNPPHAVTLFNQQVETGQVLLGTANIFLHDVNGNLIPARALLDGGSQANLVTRELANKLHLPTITTEVNITGVGNSQASSHQRIFSRFSSTDSRFSENAEFVILPVITTLLPTQQIKVDKWNIPSHFRLADDKFNTPSPIDVLLGADLFYTLLQGKKLPGNSNRPTLIKTKLGWICGGEIPRTPRARSLRVHLSLSDQLEKFWRMDECASVEKFTAEELECEGHFVKNHHRDSNGRYVMRLPFKENSLTLGHSRSQARRRWLSVESRLARDDTLRESYHKFMKQYLELGHMSLIGPEIEVPDKQGNYFLPHHPVFKNQSTSTKVRVVFDASMKTSSGKSLNNILMTGLTIQSTLFEILLRFRRHCYVLVADVQQMYRQVMVNKSDRTYQLIFWRGRPTEQLCVYELNTVTYGTAPALFLATRSLKQLALDEQHKFPNAATTVLEDFYVDDLLTGHETLDGALTLQRDLITLLAHGGFPLKKWASNHPALISNIPESDRETLTSLTVASEDAMKTLGLTWIPTQDTFLYDASNISKTPGTTKRQILSQIASLFDPLGLIGPLVCSAKMFMQELWMGQYDWDCPLPTSLTDKWKRFHHSLSTLTEIRIPRFTACPLAKHYEVHGFADASESAFGCAIYLKTKNSDSKCSVTLICAKSRVAPVKKVTLPRLELSAALLLVRQLTTVTRAMKLTNIPIYCWSDSRIVLSWLASPPHQWKTFVANRVAEIQEYEATWKYVQSDQNPADLISRGATLSQLKNSQVWWEGPTFLIKDQSPLESEAMTENQVELPEKRKAKIITMATVNTTNDLFKRFSALHTLVNITAWIHRFINNSRKLDIQSTRELSPLERQNALHRLLCLAQSESLSTELSSIARKGYVSKRSKLRHLAPFLDEGGLLRVGGRLKNSCLSETRRHPIILTPDHPLTKLLITQAHLQCLHGGAQLVLTILRHKYWIINGKNIIRKLLHQCISCFRARPTNLSPMMGQLPTIRIMPARPFFNTGIDFAGPFLLKSPTRSSTKLKYYVAVFVCMCTKAIHLELVGSLTTDNFLAVLKRFVSRRGLCQSISCDNATNFVGARNTLKEVYQFLRKEHSAISHHLSEHQIKWNFIPPLTPHWGGIWEAGVKSMKYHLKRVAGLAFLTYKEFLTILCAIEACLNSRPLTALSSDPSDFEALTPGHFLIGAPLLAVPELDYREQPLPRLTRWHRTQAITQQFWRRWSAEYISSLMPLAKWTEETTPLAVDKLVLLKDDHLPPLQWRLGRIVETHPGKDGIIRVATIKTTSGNVIRNASKIFPLPIDAICSQH